MFDLKIKDYIHDESKKRYYNEAFFTEAASRYNFATKALSLFRDMSWKKYLVQSIPATLMPKVALDLACGTGDVGFLLAKHFPSCQITGLDLTKAMLDIAESNNRFSNLGFKKGCMEKLPFRSSSVDLVTGSYALRNSGNLLETVCEVSRVLRPGGVAAFLDFSKPSNAFLQRVQYIILRCWGGFWGLVLHGNPEIHGYLADSLFNFISSNELDSLLAKHNLLKIKEKKFYLGTLRVVYYTKC